MNSNNPSLCVISDNSSPNNDKFVDEGIVKIRPKLRIEAYHGFTLSLVNTLCDQTEVLPELALCSILNNIICSIPRDKVFMEFGADKTTLTGYFLLVSPTGAGKGLTEKSVSTVFKKVNQIVHDESFETLDYNSKLDGLTTLTTPVHGGGLSSGEGFVHAIRDDVFDDKGSVSMHGVLDKRLLVIEYEFANIFKQFKRPDNTLSVYLRNNFDYQPIHPLTKTSKTACDKPRACITGHITPQELLSEAEDKSITNGELNRFFIGFSLAAQPVPRPKTFSDELLRAFAYKIKDILEFVIKSDELLKIEFSERAGELWDQEYIAIKTAIKKGKEGFLLARQLYYYRTFSMLFAVIDKTLVITELHLAAARALIDWGEESVRYVFNTEFQNNKQINDLEVDETLLQDIRQLIEKGNKIWTNRAELLRKNRKLPATKLNEALKRLQERASPPILINKTGKNSIRIELT
jgi:hypothetical protein